ncbi:MAG: hypothetical protein KatS3mg030_443 [Saprospiraceae bacterium]|nr:MAG: hypothetical protein KatS3mg030_443 [Saprospiraceae bacterium]
MADKKVQPPQLQIELPDNIADGEYSNLAVITHNQTEFVFDFIRMAPNMPKARVKARVILTPEHAKRFFRALSENLKKYEAQFGSIHENDVPPFPPMSFNTPPAQA